MEYAKHVPLFDHHCHGLVQKQLHLDEFAALATEGDWLPENSMTVFDSPFGIAMLRICAPVLGLGPECGIDEYVTERVSRDFREVTDPLLASSGTTTFGIETGFPREAIASPEQMSEITGEITHTIVRLEAIAESVAAKTEAGEFFDRFCVELDRALAAGAIGVKSIAAYRFGLDLPDAPPSASELSGAVADWYRTAEASGSFRLSDRTVIGALIWAAIERAQAIQLHIGFGDTDVQLDTADPSLLTPLLRASENSGARFALLHCYPFVRQAGVLAHVFPHVYFDVSCVSHYAGPSAMQLVSQAFEVAPFSRVLYASDAYGIPEHYAVSASLWRTGMSRLLDNWVEEGFVTSKRAETICTNVANRNARTLYRLEGSTA